MIKQAYWSQEVDDIHRHRELMRAKYGDSCAWDPDVFKAFLDAMEEVDPGAKEAMAIAEELSKKKRVKVMEGIYVTRIQGDVEKSIIERGRDKIEVHTLPLELRVRMIKLLNLLPGVKRISVWDKRPDGAVFELPNITCTLDHFEPEIPGIRKQFTETIKLLAQHLKSSL